MPMSLRSKIKRRLPWWAHYLYRKIYYLPQDLPAALGFVFHGTRSPTAFGARAALIGKFYKISYYVDCPHTEHELITIARRILDLGDAVPGVIVEAGAFHGGSTAKLSLVAALAARDLHVFDSFEGMPANAEAGGKSIYGREHHFPQGSHAVPFDEVKNNVAKYGAPARAHFHKGFFKDTMPQFHERVAVACVNVDLAESTRDCLHYLYPLAAPGGIIFSQDAHFPWIIALLDDDAFWQKEIGVKKPLMEGLGHSKFVAIRTHS
jgi:O-methyltransferase